MCRTHWFKGIVMPGLLVMALLSTASYGAAVGDWVSTTQSGNQIDFVVGAAPAKVRIYFCSPSIVRVSFDTRGLFTSSAITYNSGKDVLGMSDVTGHGRYFRV